MAYSVSIDHKWQDYWQKEQIAQLDATSRERLLYVLEMFSYPSGAKLHIGHWYNYALSDSWARMKKMQGYNVFQPMGFDAFGLPAENYAIQTGIHPQDSTEANIKTMKQQLQEMGGLFNWDHELATCDPEYYRWTQWLFLQLYKHNLAYRKNAPVNWCPSCHTVLANEQVKDGLCERCGSEITKKNLTQWFFSITNYAQELLDALPSLDWPDKTKKIQTNWIGRSEGSDIIFGVEKEGKTQFRNSQNQFVELRVFTTRADTLLGVTYVVVAPESELCDLLTTSEQRAEIEAYKNSTKKISDIDRMSTTREKTGVFTGSYAIHPITNERVPVWVSDYVIAAYGTGVVMAVPAHDSRDFEFAQKFNLPIRQVIGATDGRDIDLPFVEKGRLVNSGIYDDLDSMTAIETIVADLAKTNQGEQKINYRLKDWLVSRQRYWGAPIPIIYCPDCGPVPVPEADLPVKLPYDVAFTPDGESPLQKSKEFMNTTCPHCNQPAKRDPDTLDTFVCSSWYQFRYPDNKNTKEAFAREIVNAFCPVDKYIGGAEHAAMHLLYARFITKALRDMGYLDFNEPFTSLVHQGTILGTDGQKMSKSKGNTVSPDEYVTAFGSDALRMYLGFGFAYTEGGPWSDDGVKAIARFISRIDRTMEQITADLKDHPLNSIPKITSAADKALNYARHFAIKGVTADAEKFQFNTSISRIMELLNAIQKYQAEKDQNLAFLHQVIIDFIKIMAPFAPHFAEELWHNLGMTTSVFLATWPEFDPAALIKDSIEIAVQFNGQVKFRLDIPTDATADEVQSLIEADEEFKLLLGERQAVKWIYIKSRLMNIVVKG